MNDFLGYLYYNSASRARRCLSVPASLCVWAHAQTVKKLQWWLCLGLAAVSALTMCASIAVAQEPLEALSSDFIPVPSPSFDTTRNNYVIGSHTYQIPRNYIRFAEKDGSLISMDTLLSDMNGLSHDTASCFQNLHMPCSSDVVTILLSSGEINPFSQRIANIRTISQPKTKWICGFEYYEDTTLKANHNGFRWLFKDFDDGIGGVLLRCPDEASIVTRACSAHENIGDGNSLHYIFQRDKMCNWSDIRAKVRSLIGSFKLK